MDAPPPNKPCPFCEAEISATAKKCRYCGEWIAESGVDGPGRPGKASVQPRGDTSFVPGLDSGSRLSGRYLLERRLGKGGMAEVWAATDEKLTRSVAIKTIPAIVMEDKRLRRALEDEARLVMDLHHENIRAVHGLDEDPTAGSYLVMELVQGLSLSEVLGERTSGRLTADEALEIGRQVCEGVEYAHGKGVIHRDLKPKNLFLEGVTAEDAGNALDRKALRVKVMDFGLGVRVRDSVVSRSRFSSETSGTLAYMSPEQVNGDKPSASMDLYSVGATLYELLTGDPPFVGGDVPGQILRKAAPRLTDAPSWLADTVAACLAKQPEARPRSAAELRGHLIASTPPSAAVPAPPAPPPVTVRSALRRASESLAPLDPSHPFFPRAPHPMQLEEARRLDVPLAVRHEVTGMAMVLIPRGQFVMGAVAGDLEAFDDEKPPHAVTIRNAFYLGVTLVTVAEYLEYTRHSGVEPPYEPLFNRGWEQRNHPIVNVSWKDAARFCEWAGMRLPTEAQWEYAGRGGLAGKKYPWGDERPSDQVGAKNGARFHPEGATIPDGTTPVASFGPNGFGLHDIAGNAWEWVADSAQRDYRGAPSDGSAWIAQDDAYRRVLRGAAWNSRGTQSLRVSYRTDDHAGLRGGADGFRCCRDVTVDQ